MIKKILITIFVILVIFGLFIVGVKLYSKQKYAPDKKILEEKIFQKDSENRGYSDVVKEKIEKEYKQEKVRKSIGLYAKALRNVVRSDSEDELVERSGVMFRAQSCVYFLMDQDRSLSMDFSKLAYDNAEMKKYYEYLSFFRFRGRRVDQRITDQMNSQENQVETKDEYEARCN